MQHLFITLEGKLRDSSGRLLEQYTQVSGAADMVVWAPSEHITLLEVNIPTRNAVELEQSLPYALEEELLEDIEQLHFAWKLTPKNQPLQVAVVRKEVMAGWVELIKPLHLVSPQLVPDVFSLPCEDQPVMLLDGKRTLLRTDQCSGFAASHTAVLDYVKIQELQPLVYKFTPPGQHQSQQSARLPPSTTAPSTTPGKNWLRTRLGRLSGKKLSSVIHKPGAQLQPQAASIARTKPSKTIHLDSLPLHPPGEGNVWIDLLQGDFVTGAAFARMFRRSSFQFIGLVIIAVLILAHQVVQYTGLRKEANHFSALLEERVQEIIPGYSSGQPIQPLLARHVENLNAEQVRRQAHPWVVLENAIPLLRTCVNCVFETMSLDEHSISIKVSSFSQLTRLDNQLKGLAGYKVATSLSSTPSGENTSYTLNFTLTVDDARAVQ